MRIAVPVSEGRFSGHFGQSQGFVLFDVDLEKRTMLAEVGHVQMPQVEHGCRAAPGLLREQQVDRVIVGGIGQGALANLERCGIDPVVGAVGDQPRQVVEDYLADRLELGANQCGH